MSLKYNLHVICIYIDHVIATVYINCIIAWNCVMNVVLTGLFYFRTQKHPVTKLFTFSLVLEFIALCFNVLHTVKFAVDGVGFAGLAAAGDVLDIMSRVSYYILLISVPVLTQQS